MTDTPKAIAVAKRAFDEVGRALADELAGPVRPFTPGRQLPSRAMWFTDEADERLIVVIDHDAGYNAVDQVFAYAVAWQRDRDLLLILPADHADRVLYRLPWIATPVRVWTVANDSKPQPVVVPTRDEVLARAAAWPVHTGEHHNLGADGDSWVAPLVETVESHWALTPAHRYSYRAWHCEGRQVLRLRRNAQGVNGTAGVQYTKPKPCQPKPHVDTVNAPLTPAQRACFEAAIARAISDRLNELDNADVEHRMQAALAAAEMPGLKLMAHPAREYPAWRPGQKYSSAEPVGRRGYLDFLGIDRQSRLHVVETKVGGDGMLVLQALDYLIWVTAQAASIREDRGWTTPDTERPVQVDLVLAPKGKAPAIGPYTASQLEALAGDVSWRVLLVDDPHAAVPAVKELPRDELFDPQAGMVAKPVQPRRFAGRVQHQLRKAMP